MSRRWRALLLLLALVAAALLSADAACPSNQAVLDEHNRMRAAHRVPPLTWDAGLAAKAQAHANTCKWGHTDGRKLAGAGENLYASGPPVTYPFKGRDVCSYGTYALYLEVTSYDFATHKSRDGVQIGHLVNILWKGTTKLGCGHRKCPGSGMDYVVCWFYPGFYLAKNYTANMFPSTCQVNARDSWCSECSGSTCTKCFERPMYGQPMGREKIVLDPTTKKCVSKCRPGAVPNCAACRASNVCARCNTGFRLDAQARCVRARINGQTQEELVQASPFPFFPDPSPSPAAGPLPPSQAAPAGAPSPPPPAPPRSPRPPPPRPPTPAAAGMPPPALLPWRRRARRLA